MLIWLALACCSAVEHAAAAGPLSVQQPHPLHWGVLPSYNACKQHAPAAATPALSPCASAGPCCYVQECEALMEQEEDVLEELAKVGRAGSTWDLLRTDWHTHSNSAALHRPRTRTPRLPNEPAGQAWRTLAFCTL